MAKIRTHYDNLKVARNAPSSVIKAAYKALCQTYHPDKFQGGKQEADRIMKIVNASYEVLIDPFKRAVHDRWIDEQETKPKQQGEKQQFHNFDEPSGQQCQQRQDNPKTEQPFQSTYSNPNNAPPNTNTGSQSIPRTSGWLRFFARMFDVWWETLIVTYFLAFFLARYSTGFMEWLGNTPNADKTFVLLCIPIALILDTTIYSIFGNTPGKAWIGLKVKNNDDLPLNFSQYLGRNFKFYVSGFALGLPIIGLFPMINQSIRLRKGQKASYDEATGFRVFEQPVGWFRKSIFGLAFVCLAMVMLVLNTMGENAQRQASTLSSNQEISNSTTSQHEHQANNAQPIFQRAIDLYNQGQYADALPLFQSLAEQGYAEPQNYLGSMYYSGNGVTQDYTQAVYWYQKAAQQGSASAQVSMGWSYMNGLGGLPKDYKQAAYWNELGANNGHSEGANNLGWLYEHGLGVAQDLTKATELYQYAINKGTERGVEKERIDEAKSRLANLTKLRQRTNLSDNGRTVTKNSNGYNPEAIYQNAIDLYKQGNPTALRHIEYLAKQGYTPAQAFLNLEKQNELCIIKPVMTKAEIENCQN